MAVLNETARTGVPPTDLTLALRASITAFRSAIGFCSARPRGAFAMETRRVTTPKRSPPRPNAAALTAVVPTSIPITACCCAVTDFPLSGSVRWCAP